MKTRFLRLACLCGLASLPSFAGSWSGWLVDSKCYVSLETNRNDMPSYVNWDVSGAIRYCSPYSKTKSLAIVQQDQSFFKLDSAGNKRVRELLSNTSHKSLYLATVKGNLSAHVIGVQDISIAKQPGR